jgi:LuxR family maltose regulon positive regulatory protein
MESATAQVEPATAAPAAPVVVATKLQAPPDRRGLIPRPDLLARLSRAPRPRLVLVSAPAGSGKTTLLAAWYASGKDERPAGWLSLDRADNAPVRFWTYVIESLRGFASSVGGSSLPVLTAPGTDVLRDVLPRLVNELADLAGDLALVLDDYHEIDDEQIHAGVAFLVDHAPANLQLLIATRADPPLPLPRLRARGELLELRGPDFRFSLDEARALLNDTLGLALAEPELRLLLERTEGWPAGLYLAALSLQDRDDARSFVETFAGDDRNVADYLIAEVLAAQPPDLRNFLVRTSILDRMAGQLCDAVLGTSDSAQRLESLERANLFVVPLDARREWYRYHHLFGELLRRELDRSGEETVRGLHRRAAEWLLEAGVVAEAILHTIAAGALDDTGELIARWWHPFVNTGQNAAVATWFARLPDTFVRGDARLCLARAWMLFSFGRFEEMTPWLDAAESAPLPAPFADGTASVAAGTANARASQLNLLGELEAAREWAARAAELEPTGSPWRAIALVVLGNCAYWLGDRAEACAHFEETVRLGREQIPLVAVFALGQLALAAAEDEEWERTRERLAEASELIERHGAEEYWMGAMTHLARGRLLQRDRRDEEARAELERAVELARRGSSPAAVAYAQAALADFGARAEHGPRPAHRPHAYVEELSDREREVLRLLATPLSQREIGNELYLSLNTVKSHVKSIFRKLGVTTRSEAVRHARERELV